MHRTVMIFMILECSWMVSAFNLSPEANYVFKQPTLKTFIQPTRSSYFGFSINLRTSSVMVGAPRAQSDVEYQRNINETGAIYKCAFNAPFECEPYRLDRQGNTNYEDPYRRHPEIRSERKEFQMLGATVDGHGSDDASFVACAPQRKGVADHNYFLHGICFLTEGIRDAEEPNKLHKIRPLRRRVDQKKGRSYNYIYGEQGFSLHVTDDGNEVLIGAPGVMDWRGTVIRCRQKSTRGKDEPDCIVPDPQKLNLTPDSYLGYAVSSGRFLGTQTMLYVASAPQARGQHGEVIIFDYTDNHNLRRYQTFTGQQFGEYFGYSLLTEDFNSDGLPDLAIGAPMHSRNREYDNGLVYVMLNGGEMNFDLNVRLSSAHELGGRFGTSLGKIGDLNRDGYGDIAIGAPFEDDGAVYIHLGSANGLQSRASQRLAPSNAHPTGQRVVQPRMFGHALSRGVDIDQNGYVDLAIGAPNEETVYVYRTYPIVRIEARINSTQRELPPEGGTFQIGICWSTEYPAEVPFEVALQYTLDVDGQMGRADVTHRGVPMSTKGSVTVGIAPLCIEYNISVRASPTNLYKPIVIDLEFNIADTATPPRKEGPFCTHCAILDPRDTNRVQEWIPFETGCRTDTCQTDLRITALRWVDVVLPYIVGRSKRATIEVEIENAGENAYLPQLNVTFPASLRLGNSPPECTILPTVGDQSSVLCELNNGLPLNYSERIKYPLIFDMTRVEAADSVVNIRAKALTSSKEVYPQDNEFLETLPLHEFSHVDIVSKLFPREVNLEEQKGMVNVTQLVKLHNNGSSTLNEAVLVMHVPLTYVPGNFKGQKKCQIIRVSDISITTNYNGTPLEVNWVQPDIEEGLLKQTFDFYSRDGTEQIPSNEKMYTEVPSNIYTHNHVPISTEEHEVQFSNNYESTAARRKRSNLWVQPAARPSYGLIQTDELPATRTVYFNCAQNQSTVECLQLQVRLPPFPAGHKPIVAELKYKLNPNAIEACLEEQEDIFVTQILNDLQKPSDEERKTYQIARNNPHTVAYRDASVSTPIWIYSTSSIGGLLLLAGITYIMQRLGFFKRHMKHELEELYRQSLMSITDSIMMAEGIEEVSEI